MPEAKDRKENSNTIITPRTRSQRQTRLSQAREGAGERETRRKRKGLELRSQSILTAHLLQLE